MKAGELELFSTQELIDELLRRTTFQGVVVYAVGGAKDRHGTGSVGSPSATTPTSASRRRAVAQRGQRVYRRPPVTGSWGRTGAAASRPSHSLLARNSLSTGLSVPSGSALRAASSVPRFLTSTFPVRFTSSSSLRTSPETCSVSCTTRLPTANLLGHHGLLGDLDLLFVDRESISSPSQMSPATAHLRRPAMSGRSLHDDFLAAGREPRTDLVSVRTSLWMLTSPVCDRVLLGKQALFLQLDRLTPRPRASP